MAHVPKMACKKVSLMHSIHCCHNFVLFLLPDMQLYIVKYIYVYTHISDSIEIVYELLFLPNYTGSELFLHKPRAV